MNNNATNQSQNPNNNSPNQFNYTKWGFILAIVATLAAILAIPPDVKCIVLESAACPQKRDFDIAVQNDAGEVLPGVKILVIGQGPSESTITDSNGYGKVRIPSKGDVRVSMSKIGYLPQNVTINLENEQSTTRIVQLTKQDTQNVKITSTQANESVPFSTNITGTFSNLPLSQDLFLYVRSQEPRYYLNKISRKKDGSWESYARFGRQQDAGQSFIIGVLLPKFTFTLSPDGMEELPDGQKFNEISVIRK
jgi:CarboxypepD_reg-like domain